MFAFEDACAVLSIIIHKSPINKPGKEKQTGPKLSRFYAVHILNVSHAWWDATNRYQELSKKHGPFRYAEANSEITNAVFTNSTGKFGSQVGGQMDSQHLDIELT